VLEGQNISFFLEVLMRRYLQPFLILPLALFACPLFAQNLSELSFDSAPNLLKLPADIYLGEAAGVAQNSKCWRALGGLYYTGTTSIPLQLKLDRHHGHERQRRNL